MHRIAHKRPHTISITKVTRTTDKPNAVSYELYILAFPDRTALGNVDDRPLCRRFDAGNETECDTTAVEILSSSWGEATPIKPFSFVGFRCSLSPSLVYQQITKNSLAFSSFTNPCFFLLRACSVRPL